VVSNNSQTASTTINMSAAAPGIFTNSDRSLTPASKAARGQVVTLYFTGAGGLQPAVATGATPSGDETPVPTQAMLVTVGGEKASTTYVGQPSWSVGVLQINFTVPSTVGAGTQPVVVSVGGVSSQTATLNVTE
jgi:uncharacterized protein (TIGR03437 family)